MSAGSGATVPVTQSPVTSRTGGRGGLRGPMWGRGVCCEPLRCGAGGSRAAGPETDLQPLHHELSPMQVGVRRHHPSGHVCPSVHLSVSQFSEALAKSNRFEMLTPGVSGAPTLSKFLGSGSFNPDSPSVDAGPTGHRIPTSSRTPPGLAGHTPQGSAGGRVATGGSRCVS